MKVLLIGHACGPGMGSEPGFTWNWAQHLSTQHQVWVVTHPQFRSKVDDWMTQHPNPNLRFVWVDVKSVLDVWKPGRSERGIRFHYMLWLKVAYAAARKLCVEETNFDLAHHVSWGTLRAAPPLWRLPVPSVWGPIGGGQCAPFAFLRYFGWRAGQEIFRILSTRSLYFSSQLRRAVRSAAVIFATNQETANVVKPFDGANVKLFLDCGLPAEWIPATAPVERAGEPFTLLWVGRLEHRKALALALEALARIPQLSVRLLVAGSGGLRHSLEELSGKLGLTSRVHFLGSVPYEEMPSLFRSANAFLFTSLRDSFGSVVLEAMACGLPIITLRHQGVGTFVPDEAGIKVPVTAPDATIGSLSEAIEKLAQSRTLRHRMQMAAWNFAKQQTWDRRAAQMSKIYEEVISLRNPQPFSTSRTPIPSQTIGVDV